MAILFTGAGVGDIGVEVEDPQGKNSVELLVEDRGNQVYRCVYKPLQPGPHVVKVSFAGDAIPKSPFGVQIGEGKYWPALPGMETDRPETWAPSVLLLLLLPGPLQQEVVFCLQDIGANTSCVPLLPSMSKHLK